MITDISTVKPIRLSSIEQPDKADSLEQFKKEMGEATGVVNMLLERAKSGRVVTEDEWRSLQEKEEANLKKLNELEVIAKAAASRTSGWVSDADLISKARFVLEPDDDLKDIDRTYYNVMALRPEELIGLTQLDERLTPGVSRAARRFGADRNATSSMALLARAQKLNDSIHIKDQWLCGKGNTRWAQSGPPEVRMRKLKEWPEYERAMTEIYRALNEGTGSQGGFLVPVILSSRIGDIKELVLKVAALFTRFTMTSKTFEWPFLGGHVQAYAVTEDTSDHATYAPGIGASTPVFTKPVWTARKMGILTFSTNEADEDAITPALPWLEGEFGRALGHGEEEAIINGELNAATMDAAHALNGAASGGVNNAGIRRLFSGLRYYSLMTGSYPSLVSAGAADVTISGATGVIALLSTMGAWGVDPSNLAFVVGYKAYNSLRKLPEMITREKYGDAAVVVTGEVAKLLGSPVVLSEKIALGHTDGKLSATGSNNTHGSMIAVDRTRWAIGDRRSPQIDFSEHVAFRNDQLAVRGTERLDFEPMDTPSATLTPVGLLYDIG